MTGLSDITQKLSPLHAMVRAFKGQETPGPLGSLASASPLVQAVGKKPKGGKKPSNNLLGQKGLIG